jgi:hypothetical protein
MRQDGASRGLVCTTSTFQNIPTANKSLVRLASVKIVKIDRGVTNIG